MKFKTPCFVRVEDAEKRDELIAYCKKIGYLQKYACDNKYLTVIAGFEPNQVDTALWCKDLRDAMLGRGLIDCGTDIELFKALAAMNDENDREQWFTDTADGFSKCSVDRWLDEWQPEYHDRYSIWRKATVEEIVEHFKNRQQ